MQAQHWVGHPTPAWLTPAFIVCQPPLGIPKTKHAQAERRDHDPHREPPGHVGAAVHAGGQATLLLQRAARGGAAAHKHQAGGRARARREREGLGDAQTPELRPMAARGGAACGEGSSSHCVLIMPLQLQHCFFVCSACLFHCLESLTHSGLGLEL